MKSHETSWKNQWFFKHLLEPFKMFCGQNNSSSASVVGPEEEREPLGFRTFFDHHDVVMMMTWSTVLRTLSARVSWRKNRKCVTKPVLKHHTSGCLRHETPAESALKSAPVHALLRDPLAAAAAAAAAAMLFWKRRIRWSLWCDAQFSHFRAVRFEVANNRRKCEISYSFFAHMCTGDAAVNSRFFKIVIAVDTAENG